MFLDNVGELSVRQKKEWGEILTGFEARNKYEALAGGAPVALIGEESSLLARWFLKKLRPLVLHVLSPQGQELLLLRKAFAFFFPTIDVLSAAGAGLGTIRVRWALLSRRVTVEDALGREIYEIRAPFLHPWTFTVFEGGREVGVIAKKWSGLGKEMFTDADNFGMRFPSTATADQKALLFGALFLIDLAFFERR